MNIKFIDVAEEREGRVSWDVRSVITMTLLRLGYLVYSLGNRAMTLLTETGLITRFNPSLNGRNDKLLLKFSEGMSLSSFDHNFFYKGRSSTTQLR